MSVAHRFLTVVLICVAAIAGFAALLDALLWGLGKPLSLTQLLIAAAIYAAGWFGVLAWAGRQQKWL